MPLRPLATGALTLALLPALAPAADDGLGLYFGQDRLVESATRAPKPLSQVAENVTVVTAAEILAMQAKTLGEVLERVPGVYVQALIGGRRGDVYLAHIQGSGEPDFFTWGSLDTHVTLLLNGVSWTQVGSGAVLLNTVPVGIIERIEIIKGPASATWGSALGGVINVITKKAGTIAEPTGAVAWTRGEGRVYDGRAEAAGALGPVGYYLAADGQGAEWGEGLGTRYNSRSLFAQFAVRPSRHVTVGFALGRIRPGYQDESDPPVAMDYRYEARHANVTIDARLSPVLTAHWGGSLLELGQDSELYWDGTPYGALTPPAGEFLSRDKDRERHRGLTTHLVWATTRHTATIGADYFRGRVENTYSTGPTAQAAPPAGFGWLPYDRTVTYLERYGLFANDTLRLGPLTLTAGVRFDDTSKTDAFVSPSLGAVLRVGPATLLRAGMARGFTTPPLAFLSGDTQIAANPNLKAEKVWSWQGGVETGLVPGLALKLTAFRHEMTDSHEYDPVTWDLVNWPHVWRTGFEAEAESGAWHGLSARGNFAWARVEKARTPREQDLYQSKLGLAYRRGTLLVDLAGRFVWWDMGPGSGEGDHNDFLWDLTASKTVIRLGGADLDLFGAVRNVFNGDQYTALENPGRWVEGGWRVRF